MSYLDIVSNLDRNYLSSLIKKLKVNVLKRELFSENQFWGSDQLSNEELKYLAEASNILSGSQEVSDRVNALEIAVYLPQVSHSKGIYLSSFLVLRKLGNYPAIKLLEGVKEINEYKSLLSGVSLLEEYVFESFNEKRLFGENYLLSNFQRTVYDLISKNQMVSLSAPTSAGKSYILLKYILHYINNMEKTTVIYIVPTRALIKQVMNDFTKNIIEFKLNNIYVGCSSEVEALLKNKNRSNILVLTQERLYQLCSQPDARKLNVRIVVADEAHNIQSEGRGVLLERAVSYVKDLFPNVKVLFSSPLVRNPEKLLSTFNFEGKNEKNLFPLVSQNIIEVKQTNKYLKIFTKINGEDIELNRISYGINNNSKESILANVTIKLWNNKNSIIYSNEPILSSNIARKLVNSGEFPVLNDDRLEEFAEFIEEFISKNYELADFIRRGIAFHFGALPPIIRSGIEELFKEGTIKIVCCTSTLLEGLNMPAKNIFIYKPEKGRGIPIDNLNFWNLAGRAGRMGNDFSGNIICINTSSWKDNPIYGERQFSITPSSELRLTEESDKFKEFIKDRKKSSGIDDYNEQLVSWVIKKRLVGIKLVDTPFKNINNECNFNEIDEISEKIINDFLPPKVLLNDLPGIVPDRLNDFWVFLTENIHNYKELLPIRPFYLYDKGYNRFKEIIKYINKYFITNSEWSEDYVKKIAVTGYRWTTGQSLSQIIFYKKDSNLLTGKKLTSHVKGQIDFLNNNIRYEMVKYTHIYTQVLKVFLEFNGLKEEADKLVNFYSYLEFGASEPAALEFMALGLPREAAIKLSDHFDDDDSKEPDIYIQWLKNFDPTTINIPKYLIKQIKYTQSIL